MLGSAHNTNHPQLITLNSKLGRLGVLRPPMPWHKPIVRAADGEVVILLHGLWRSLWAMDPMAKHLNQQGYHTINIPYPSFRKTIDELVDFVHEAVQLYAGNRRVHFVTHSLGGIIARNLLPAIPPEQTGRVVMLAPPNQGSEIIDWIEHCPPLRATLGPAGKELGTNQIDAPPIPNHTDTAVVMGKRSSIPFFRTFLDTENDGIVSVQKGKVDGMNEFHIINSDHTFIVTEPEVMQLTSAYLRDGRAI